MVVGRAALLLGRTSRRYVHPSAVSFLPQTQFSSRNTSSGSKKLDAFVCVINPTNPSHHVGNLDVGKQWASARTAGSKKALESRVVYGQDGEVAALVSVGADIAKKEALARREAVRRAAGKGVGLLRELAADGNAARVKEVGVSLAGAEEDWHAAAVGAKLALRTFTLKTKKDADPSREISVIPAESNAKEEWTRGSIYAEAQILARELMELPANMLTPTTFCERIRKEAEGLDGVTVTIRDEAWAKEKGMNTFLSVTKGTDEPAKFLEFHYKGAPSSSSSRPLAFVGKGVTFDSGGISLKPGDGMKLMRGDMGGAATVCAAALAIARLKIPIDLVVVTPLCENMPGPSANKPGDIVYAMNGKSVEIDNTDAEGRLILSDALYYTSSTYKPRTLVDVATLTGAMQVALGDAFSGVFSTSDSLWDELHAAGEHEFDRFWRMPLDDEFGPQIWSSNADLCNLGGKPAGSCTAALFLKAFVDGIETTNTKDADGSERKPTVRWAHVDIAGTMEAVRPGPYQPKGMTGRPVRALIEFARRLAQDETRM
ncbi:leucine aminopeptidase [Schizopora paradoxa]|uniref:leucyl aminopeptidase n=1 Tax=Schizopora paradoxa TaxID=27342 RepID=A0A0H2R6R0_9AGAM|nr:leucine aminopeptidase [Schizopora paradoxa]